MSHTTSIEMLHDLQAQAEASFSACVTLEDLQQAQGHLLGKKSELQSLLKGLKDLSDEEKKQFGPLIQAFKKEWTEKFVQQSKVLETEAMNAHLAKDWIDVTKPMSFEAGSVHPISQVQHKIERIFTGMGFDIADGPEVETEWHNFDALNIPPTHPARDMQDTFFVSSQSEDSRKNSVLRTHTSNIQIQKMLQHGAPIRLIAPGRVYRNEELDATHDATFYQFECLVVDEGISLAHLKGTLDTFLEAFFERPVKTRYRPGYFPFVEPGLEVDIWFEVPGKPGKWLELLGAGMVHPNVLRHCDVDPQKYTGFAFGLGLTRLAMMEYKIDDIRLLSSKKVDFLNQF